MNEQVLNYYIKCSSAENHGVGGGMTIEKGDIRPVINNVMRAGEELGFKVRDPNVDGPLTEGMYIIRFLVGSI